MKTNNYRLYVLTLSVLLPLVYLLPVITTPLSSDDLHNYELRVSSKEAKTKNIFELSYEAIDFYRECGRFTPIAEYSKEFAFKYFQNVFAYKVYLYFLNLVSIASFAFLLYSIGKKELIPYFIVAYGAVVQFRLQFHDPFTSLHGMYLLLGIFMFLSAACYSLFLKGRSYVLLVLSLVFFVATILTSEIGLVLVPVLFICSFFSGAPKKKIFLSALPLALCCLAYIFYVWHIRNSITKIYEGVQTNFVIPAMLDVLGKQVFATLPFSNFYRHRAIPLILAEQLSFINVAAILSILIFSAGIIVFQIRKREAGFTFSLLVIMLGLALVVFPACLIMQSIKYQQTLAYGFGYLPVFIQNFGTALLIAYLFFWMISGTRNLILPVALLLVICTASVSSFLFNKAMSKTRAYEQTLPLQSQWQSVKNGILSVCPEGSYIVLNHDYIYQAPSLYSDIFTNITGKHFKVYDLEQWNGSIPDSSSACYIFDCQKGDTIYNRIHQMNCSTGEWVKVLSTDTFMHTIRLAKVEKRLLSRFY